MRLFNMTFLVLAALSFGGASVAFAQSASDSSRAINGPANSETANQDAHKQIHAHAAHHHKKAAQ